MWPAAAALALFDVSFLSRRETYVKCIIVVCVCVVIGFCLMLFDARLYSQLVQLPFCQMLVGVPCRQFNALSSL